MYGSSHLGSPLWPIGDGFYSTRSSVHRTSPVYETAAAARGLMEQGVQVDLPEGYDLGVLNAITALTGAYDETVKLSPRQAKEVAQIALTLVNEHKDTLRPDQLAAAREVIQVILADGSHR